MNEALYILVGAVTGGMLCTIGFSLGAYYIKRTYVELTQPYDSIPNTVEEDTKITPEESYNWNTYQESTEPEKYEEAN